MAPSRHGLEARRALAVFVAGLGLGLIALMFDAAPLLVPAVALVLLGALTPLWVRLAALGLRAERHLGTDRVVEQEPLETPIIVRRGWLGAPGARLHDPASPIPIPLGDALSPLRGAPRARVRVIARFARRGRHRLPPATIGVRDPLDLARMRVPVQGAAERLLVLPRTEPVQWASAELMRRVSRAEGDAGLDALAAVELDGLRPYRPGTPASRIYWPAVARGAGLLERRLRADGESRPLVVLDTRVAGRDAEALADAAVRAAASLVRELARAGGCGLLLAGEQRATMIDRELTGWPAAHARLAVVESGARARAPGSAPLAGRSGPTLYVAAAPGERPAALRRLASTGPLVLVVPSATLVDGRPPGLPEATRALRVAGCEGFRLGARRPPRPVAAAAEGGPA